MQKAVFLDRDGVINEEVNYLHKIEDFKFVDGTIESLKYLQNLGYKLFIITNQSGISRGYYTTEDYEVLTSWLFEEFYKNNINISQIEYCPHSPDENCSCRKPKTGMIKNILKNHQIDLENSWLIGDKDSDIKCANNANIKNTIQVKSGHSFDETKSIATYICQSIKDIPSIIKS
jgi:D-glycero-D-manno-heptose 1,7-bisphosphate phosphatase